ncbi:MAG: ribosome maturation factor RimM [Candidatus Neomarinimicrobiota bacterium]|nr:ribosome maturation factor RimM [Candidatus Neomarinimicrobiota bacterium]
MKTKLFAIAKITRATGLKGDVGVRPLIRQFDEYVDRDLFIGFDENFAKDVKLTNVSGTGKKPRFHFEGLDSRDDAESMIGQLLFASINEKDPINLISPDLIGASVVTVSGETIGKLVDMMSLPAHDAYVISNNNKEVLIPVVPEFIYSVDVMEGLVTISPVEGLLD